jgi:hypothetical protein
MNLRILVPVLPAAYYQVIQNTLHKGHHDLSPGQQPEAMT